MIELLVVTAIITVVTGVVLANNARFGGVVLLENLTYDIALSIRQAQIFGIAVQRFGASTFSAGYGVHFDMSSPSNYVVFADALTENGMYDCPSPGTDTCELVQTTTVTLGYRVQSLCITPPGGAENCGISKLDIMFRRPEPDAWISGSDVSCFLQHTACGESSRIVLASPRGETMSIVVDANGQVSVHR